MDHSVLSGALESPLEWLERLKRLERTDLAMTRRYSRRARCSPFQAARFQPQQKNTKIQLWCETKVGRVGLLSWGLEPAWDPQSWTRVVAKTRLAGEIFIHALHATPRHATRGIEARDSAP